MMFSLSDCCYLCNSLEMDAKSCESSACAALVSIIIPAYNYGHYVFDAINSVRCQDYKNIEIIVVDDGSTDNTSEIVASFDGVIYVYQHNQGLSSARNHGIRVARGEYLQFLDADDLIGRTSIRKRVEYLDRHPEKSAVICRSAFFKRWVYPESVAFLHREWRQPDMGQMDIALHYFNIAPPHAFLVRKSLLVAASLFFDTKLKACEDYDFWLRLAKETGIPGQVRSCWVYYRQHADSMSRSYASQYRHDAEMCRRLLDYGNFHGTWPNLVRRSDVEYFAAMLAASLQTARRLWRLDRSAFDDFFRGYIVILLGKLENAVAVEKMTAAAYLYMSIARLTIHLMKMRDHSVDHRTYQDFMTILPVRQSFLAGYLASDHALTSSSPYTAIRLLKLDLHYFMLLLVSENDVLSLFRVFVGWVKQILKRYFNQ